MNCPVLENITFIDTPGVLSGEKQRLGRAYDFVQVTEWFADKADLILLLFDAHKLDISDEFKRVIEGIKGHDEKIRIVLNKADCVEQQQLMRVFVEHSVHIFNVAAIACRYGALMWSLGKVMATPEVKRVYISSFWDKPFVHNENKALFEKEREDLYQQLRDMPKNAAIRKVGHSRSHEL